MNPGKEEEEAVADRGLYQGEYSNTFCVTPSFQDVLPANPSAAKVPQD